MNLTRSRPARTAPPSESVWLLLGARFISDIGSRMSPIGLAFGVLAATGSINGFGLLLVGRGIAILVTVLFGGVLSDRFPRLRIMWMTDLCRSAIQGCTALVLLAGVADLRLLMCLQILFGIGEALYGPASTGVVPQLTPADRLRRMNSLFSLSRSTSRVGGPVVAGLIVATAGPAVAVGVDSLSFLLSGVCTIVLAAWAGVLPGAGKPREAMVTQLVLGWHSFRALPWLPPVVILSGLYHAVGYTAFFVLGPLVAARDFSGAASWSLVLSASGAGAVLGGVLALRNVFRRPLRAGVRGLLLCVPQLVCLALPAPLVVTETGFVHLGDAA